jgi:uncharacterized delta-60 repeat protein
MISTRVLNLTAFAALTYPIIAAPGDLDVAFGSGGIIRTAIGNSNDYANSVAIQPDGKIVVVGNAYNGANYDFGLVRYMPDGSLDSAFGTGGKVTTAVDSGEDKGNSVAIQSDGKIIVAGSSHNGTKKSFALVRYFSNGMVDTGFGTNGKAITDIGSSSAIAYSVALQPDGKIIAAGESSTSGHYNFALARYMPDGSLDSGFGTNGSVTTSFGSSTSTGWSLALQPDGKIVVAGEYSNAVALARYLPAGLLDPEFGTGGKVTTSIGGMYDSANSVAIQPDGKIVVAGNAYNGSNYDFGLVRYLSNGSLDTAFGTSGKVTTAVGGESDTGNSVAVYPDGKIVVAGSSSNNLLALALYLPDGSLDPEFGTGGKVLTALGISGDGRSTALQTNGKIVVAGWAYTGSNSDFVVARYQPHDTTTETPILTTPYTGSTSTNSVHVTFVLPEEALPGSVKLTFTGSVTRALTLMTSNESIGTHAFTFDARGPFPSSDIAIGSPIPDGSYTVMLSYRDALGNPAASSAPALSVAINIDTDGDGILDRYETGTGIYVSPTDTGTSPANSDTDGDGLNDGAEVNTYHSNPVLADTDDDGFGDGFEASTGFNPTSATSTPDTLSSIRTAVEYRFNAANAVSYRIEVSTDLASWSTLETPIVGNGSVITRFYSIEGQPKRFFRSRRN